MSGLTRSQLAFICILAAALAASAVGAQTAAPPAPPTILGPAQAATAEPAQGTGCKTIPTPTSAGGASVVQATGESLQHKNWQPTGGEIRFTVKSFVVIPPDASVLVCFRWKSIRESKKDFIETRPSRLDMDSDGKLLTVTTTVPDDLGPQPNDVATALPLVPLAEVRILARDNKKKETVADVTTSIGITHPVAAFVFAIATMIIGLGALHIAAGWRLKHPGILKANWLLRIISTPSGFASLSQLQVLLWTFVVAVSAVYVMALSGELVQITNGTLILLGIAGAAGIAAKTHTEAQGATAEAAAAKAAANKAAADIIAAQAAATPADPSAALAAQQAADKAAVADAMRAKADALKNPPATQIPKWSDLIVNENAKGDGTTTTREVDVARFQMLLFTLITATFVLMSVVTTYVIPEISTGFLTLMGISNGVYVGSKIVQGS
jgi:hypothetical protein